MFEPHPTYDNLFGRIEYSTDQSLLMEILEAREALEDAESEEEVETIRAENKGPSLTFLSLSPSESACS